MQPLADRVIVKPAPEDAIRASGLVIPTVEKPTRGIVTAVGLGTTKRGKRIIPDVNEGDAILYSKYGGTEIKVDDEDFIVLKESDIIAKIL